MKKSKPRKWSAGVVSDSLDVPQGTFLEKDPRVIALAVKEAAEKSERRRAEPYASAMSYLSFYLNRGGRTLSSERRKTIARAKDELRALYGLTRSDTDSSRRPRGSTRDTRTRASPGSSSRRKKRR